MINLDRSRFANLADSSRLEWLETNGLSGYASSSVIFANTRRYHGILVAADTEHHQRIVLVSRLDDALSLGGERFELGANFYPDVVHPRGDQLLSSFTREIFCRWEYKFEGVTVRKTIFMPHGLNCTVVRYELLESPTVAILSLQPLIAARDYHALTRANGSIHSGVVEKDGFHYLKPYVGMRGITLAAKEAAFTAAPDWYRNVQYPLEQERGFDFEEDIFSYGSFSVPLFRNRPFDFVVATTGTDLSAYSQFYAKETQRRSAILEQLPVKDSVTESLAIAADQFLISRKKNELAVIAGYPWFTEWGRDTMISLPGLTLATGRIADAKRLLKTSLGFLSEGMIPNLLPDGNTPPLYNTVDATLWFVVAAYRYWKASGDDLFMQNEMLPAIAQIIATHRKGTRFNIHVDPDDGLLSAGDATTQLTWMDARVHGQPVTARWGKAVEINALWINVLTIAHTLSSQLATKDLLASALVTKSEIEFAKKSFERCFWLPKRGYLADCVQGSTVDETCRPNQITALALPFSVVNPAIASSVLRTVTDALLTPVGLRTLPPTHFEYHAQYVGSPTERDIAYHQGTAWGYLLGPYLTALIRHGGADARSQAQKICESALATNNHGTIGSFAEIFDGDAPNTARGCPAQAWSVAELLRVWVEEIKRVPQQQVWKIKPVSAQQNKPRSTQRAQR